MALDADAHEGGRRLAEEPRVVALDVAALADPLADLRGARADDDEPALEHHLLRVSLGADRRACVPDVAQHPGTVARREEQHDPRDLVADLAANVALLGQGHRLPLPRQRRRVLHVEIDRPGQPHAVALGLQPERAAAVVHDDRGRVRELRLSSVERPLRGQPAHGRLLAPVLDDPRRLGVQARGHAEQSRDGHRDATPGAISGSTTRPSVARRLAPSICAASSTATGTSRTKPASSQSTSGSANDVSASTSASHVSRRSSARSSTKSGPTIVTWGNAVHATTPSSSACLPGTGNRASASPPPSAPRRFTPSPPRAPSRAGTPRRPA